MVQILLELDDAMARQLERVAPAKSRERSRFIRLAIQKALMESQDEKTALAYAKHPNADAAWDEWKPARRARKKP